MSRYIDAELFSKNLMIQVYLADDEDFTKAFVKGMELVKKAEEETPTADVQEVRHGKMIMYKPRSTNRNATYKCSACGKLCSSYYNDVGEWKYCPHCGAKINNKAERY